MSLSVLHRRVFTASIVMPSTGLTAWSAQEVPDPDYDEDDEDDEEDDEEEDEDDEEEESEETWWVGQPPAIALTRSIGLTSPGEAPTLRRFSGPNLPDDLGAAGAFCQTYRSAVWREPWAGNPAQ